MVSNPLNSDPPKLSIAIGDAESLNRCAAPQNDGASPPGISVGISSAAGGLARFSSQYLITTRSRNRTLGIALLVLTFQFRS